MPWSEVRKEKQNKILNFPGLMGVKSTISKTLGVLERLYTSVNSSLCKVHKEYLHSPWWFSPVLENSTF